MPLNRRDMMIASDKIGSTQVYYYAGAPCGEEAPAVTMIEHLIAGAVIEGWIPNLIDADGVRIVKWYGPGEDPQEDLVLVPPLQPLRPLPPAIAPTVVPPNVPPIPDTDVRDDRPCSCRESVCTDPTTHHTKP